MKDRQARTDDSSACGNALRKEINDHVYVGMASGRKSRLVHAALEVLVPVLEAWGMPEPETIARARAALDLKGDAATGRRMMARRESPA